MPILFFLFTLGLVQATEVLAGEVNPMTGVFREVHTDLGKADDGPMSIDRYYSTKASGAGLFGMGWGTIYETRLSVEKDGSFTIYEQGNGRANKFIRKNGYIYSVLFPVEQLLIDATGYHWIQEDGTNYTFSTSGRLLRIQDGGMSKIAANLVYDAQGRLTAIKDDGTNQVLFVRGASSLVEAIKGPHDSQATYHYDAAGKLTSAKDAAGQNFQYEYSPGLKLTLLAAPDGSKTRMTFFEGADAYRVKTFSPPNGSTVEYRYSVQSAAKPRVYVTDLALRDRQGESIATGRYEYTMTVEPTGDEWPQKIKAVIDGKPVEKTYEHCCGAEPVPFDLETLIRQTWLEAVVRVHVYSGGNHYVGTGFFISPTGNLVTNFHVMKHLTTDHEATVEFEYADGHTVKEFLVGECKDDASIDLCLVKLNVVSKRYFEPRDDNPLKGTPVYHIGNPGGERFLLGIGEFKGAAAQEAASYIEVTNPIHPGDSGGPIFTFRGRLAGVSTLIHTHMGEFQSMETGEKHYIGMSPKEIVKIRTRAVKFVPREAYFK